MAMNKKNFYETRERVRKLHEKFGADVFTSREAGETLGIDMSDAHGEPYRKFMSDFQRLKSMMVVVPVDTRINPDTGRIADYYLIVDKDVGAYNKRFSPDEKKRREQRAREIKDNYIKNVKMKHRFVAPTSQEMQDFHKEFVQEAIKTTEKQIQKTTVKHEQIEQVKEEPKKVEKMYKVQLIIGNDFEADYFNFEQQNLTLTEIKEKIVKLKELI